MASSDRDREEWLKLVSEWTIAFRLSQAATTKIANIMTDCYNGRGANPTIDQMDKTDELRANERMHRDKMDVFIRARFG